MKKERIKNIVYDKLLDKFGEREAKGVARIYAVDKEFDIMMSDEDINEILKQDIDLILNNYPVQYLVGKTYFYDRYFIVTEDTLIPRPETEELVYWIIQENRSNAPKILDIGTGTGCIPIILKKNIPGAAITAIDISKEALKVASENADNQEVIVTFKTFDFLNQKDWNDLDIFDILVSNPPYISKDEMEKMDQSTLSYEPHLALFPIGDDPLLFYKKIKAFAEEHLSPSGQIYFEINEFYVDEISDIFSTELFNIMEIRKDMQGKKRMVKILKKSM